MFVLQVGDEGVGVGDTGKLVTFKSNKSQSIDGEGVGYGT
jgi:hypothetical protein